MERWIPHNRPAIDESDVRSVTEVLRSGNLSQGPEVRAFEEEMALRFGRAGWDAVAVSSGTAALYLALQTIGVGREDRVLIPTYVCTALLHAIRLAGAEPSLADVQDGDFNLDPATAPRETGLKAIILPHTYGVPSDPAPLRALGVPVVEDAAQAPGARYRGEPAGSLGDLAVLSFYATKPLTCGQGGMVLGPRDMCEDVRDRRDYDGKRELRPRFNFQMSDLQATLGRSQLRRLDGFLSRRRETASLYAAALPPGLRTQRASPEAQPNHFRFVLRLEEVDAARRRFEDAGVRTIVPTEPWELLHRQLGLDCDPFPVAERLAVSTLSLPMQPSLTDEARQRIAAVLETLGDLG